jgi:hypothetical protein
MKQLKNYSVIKYQAKDFELWNNFIAEAKNASFLFHRNFMEYHADRFDDFSLLVFENEILKAVLPANIVGNQVFSHQGLTYGGLVLNKNEITQNVEIIFEVILLFLKSNNILELILKPIIPIYSKNPSFELDYFLIQKGASLFRKDLNLAIDFSHSLKISKSKLKHFRKDNKAALYIKKEAQFESFWNQVLIPRLNQKHNVNPVHNLEEIEYLASKFPENINQYNVYLEDEILAGITIFQTENVVKSQYGATTDKGQIFRALDFLFISLINDFKDKFAFFDMGIVNENQGKSINYGLLKQKEELGCSVFIQDHYQISIS